MKKACLIFLLTIIVRFAATAKEAFHFTPVYNYNTADMVKQLHNAKTDTAKLNALFSLTFKNNYLVESPNYIDTTYLNQIIAINRSAKLFDSSPFETVKMALHARAAHNLNLELSLLENAVEGFDAQNIEVPFLLIEMRFTFNVVNKQDDKLIYYTKKLAWYLQKEQYNNAAACYHCLAGYYIFEGDLNSAINNYLKAGDLFKNFSTQWYIHEFSTVGSSYESWGNYIKASAYLNKALKLEIAKGMVNGTEIVISDLAVLEYELKNYQGSLSYINKWKYSDNAGGFFLVLKALNYIALNRLDDAYKELQELRKEPESDIAMITSVGSFDDDYVFYKYYFAKKDMPQAESYLLKGYQLSERANEKRARMKYLKELMDFYGYQNKTQEAWKYTKLYNNLTDSVNNKLNDFKIASYENEKKENLQNKRLTDLQQQRAVQDATIKQRNIVIWVSMIGLLAVCVSIVFVYRQLQINRKTLSSLRQTQTQLIQSEKMASLGELTAGIAHEIQNPLNFVNNFSEVNTELVDEMEQEIDKGDLAEIKSIALDIKENSKKISMHGKRADAIVKGMLQHSQSGSGTKELTNLNALADECMRLAYHGLRAKDKSFNAELVTHFDESLPKVSVIPQDIVRIMLNLFNNAFYAVNQKSKTAGADYKPEVSVTTSSENGQVIIKVKDNGIGIPNAVKEKIMQPFFTTKPTGEGTGLGLSLTYDMVVKGNGGSIRVDSVEGEGSEFIISLPL